MAFRGFPVEALEFLQELEANNEREWFKANRERYEQHLRAPAESLAQELGPLGRAHLFRPWNNTRFRPGPPLKEHLGIAVGYEGAGGYYVELSLDGLLVAAGLHNPTPDQVERLRRAVDAGRSGGTLARALGRAGERGLEPAEPDLVRVPRGYPADHPRAELLRRRRVVVSRRHPLRKWLHTPQAATRIREDLDAATPLVSWLRTHVGPPRGGTR
jgi:uncharacterized protein (TIGR02453 family)